MRERQRDYELMVILSPLRSSEEDVNTTISRLSQNIADIGGEVSSVDHSTPWGRRKLAYSIRRYAEGEASRRPFSEGYYVLLQFRLGTTQLNEFERQLKLNDAVIRHLITLVEKRGQPLAVADGGSSFEPVTDEEDDGGEDEE